MENIDDQAKAWRDRLYQRQMQAARFGIMADPSISTEIEDLQKKLARVDDIKRQLSLIASYRRNLAILLEQRAMYGAGRVDVSITNQIANARLEIAKGKQALRNFYQYEVTPELIDEEQVSEARSPIDPLRRVRDRLHTLETLVRLRQKEAALDLIEELRRIVG